MDCKFWLRVDGGEPLGKFDGSEQFAVEQFYNLVRELDGDYGKIILTIIPYGDTKEYQRSVAYSDGKR